MKRLVVCFDGTWKRPLDKHVSNIEKIARTVQSETDGVQQTAYYVGGVGASYKVDRVLGGSLGLGLHNNLMSAYRFLALNYAAGDKLYLFGFSRGAFTARSLVGMIDRVGLVRPDRLIDNSLPMAEERYREARRTQVSHSDSPEEFRRKYCHKHVCIPFLGVFDTVEALGPGASFHNVDFLDGAVAMGRQALALHDRRRIFRPRLWSGDPALGLVRRVQQVWFEGHHSDIGGGNPNPGLSDTTLLWMAIEASRQGLVFDEGTLADYVTRNSDAAESHDSMNIGYWIANNLMRTPLSNSYTAFCRGARVLEPERSIGVGLSRRHTTDSSRARRDGTMSRLGWLPL